jgi:serine phosphatase RsbU (regulator of sigma subunit)
MLFEASRDAPILLEAGGSVIGLMPNCEFEQGQVTLARGDMVVAFTDGISEAMNADDEEWGEERLIACAALKRGLPAKEIIEHLMVNADLFGYRCEVCEEHPGWPGRVEVDAGHVE